MIKNQGVDVHVCGNYAASSGFKEDDFVDYVDVAARGPAQVKSYENDGYVVLFIRQPNKGASTAWMQEVERSIRAGRP